MLENHKLFRSKNYLLSQNIYPWGWARRDFKSDLSNQFVLKLVLFQTNQPTHREPSARRGNKPRPRRRRKNPKSLRIPPLLRLLLMVRSRCISLFSTFFFTPSFLPFHLPLLSFIVLSFPPEDDEPQAKRSKIVEAPEDESQDSSSQDRISEGKLPDKIDLGKESAIEAEVMAARQRAIIPLEERMKEFRGMLAEKEVRTPPSLRRESE
jgi:hypothetical protein